MQGQMLPRHGSDVPVSTTFFSVSGGEANRLHCAHISTLEVAEEYVKKTNSYCKENEWSS